MDMRWFLKYVTPCIECFGPAPGWYLFGVHLSIYPYMILVAAFLSPVIYLTIHSLLVLLGKRKRYKGWILKKNFKEVVLMFLVIMILQIIFVNWLLVRAVF